MLVNYHLDQRIASTYRDLLEELVEVPLDLLLEDDIRPPLVLLRVLYSEVHSDLLDLLGAGKLGGAVTYHDVVRVLQGVHEELDSLTDPLLVQVVRC